MKISIKNLKFCLAGFILLLMIFLSQKALALDPNNEMPVPYWGMPSASWTQTGLAYKIYAEPQATEVVRNVALETLPDILFSPQCVIDKTSAEIDQRCVYFDVSHYLNPTSSLTTKVMNSRTYANGYLKSATAVFVYPDRNIIGDSFNADGNFSYWGRHLKQNTGSADSNALWQAGNYQFNPAAQAYWKTSDQNKNLTMTDTINRLKQNSKQASGFLALGNSWTSGTFDGICGLGGTSCSETNQYSDGRVWYTAPTGGWGLFANTTSVSYSRKSSLIIESGNPTVREDIQIDRSFTPADNNSSLGFIVTNGDVYIQNLSTTERLTIKANFFVPNGTIHTWGNNIDFTGSFVASNFDIAGASINFVQDTRPESSWPPGFRDLMPLSSKSK